MAKEQLHPFENESESLQIEGMAIENREDRVSFYGSIDITKDIKGLANVEELLGICQSLVEKLKREKLSEKIAIAEHKKVKNPFT